MPFKKPFRAVPIKQGAHYAAQRRKRRRERYLSRLLVGVTLCAGVGAVSLLAHRSDGDGDGAPPSAEQSVAAGAVAYVPQPAMSAAELDAQQPSAGGAAAAMPRRTAPAASGWSYRDCSAARAAGAAPLYVGQPGYGAHMDADGDGIACEPYMGQRWRQSDPGGLSAIATPRSAMAVP